MATVDVDDSSLQKDSHLKLVGFVSWPATTWL